MGEVFLSPGLTLPPSPRTKSPAAWSWPGMGNGVKESAVRVREDAEAVLPSPVNSKASTPPPRWAFS